MRILFVHQNFPAQFVHLAKVLAADPAHEVVALTLNGKQDGDGIRVVRYQLQRGTSREIHPWAADFESKVIRADALAKEARKLRDSGFVPDLIYAHPGWGESLFLRDVFPDSRLVCFAEFYYRGHGLDVGFDPEFTPIDEDLACNIRARNAHNLLSFEACDAAIAPTEWQRSTYPEFVRAKTHVVHDGIDTELLRPDDRAQLRLGQDGPLLACGDKVVTYVGRNLEPYRGFPTFMRSLPALQRKHPDARIVVVGGDAVSYGARRGDGKTYKQLLLNEVGSKLDMSRIHFVGQVPYKVFTRLLQISAAHIYLTYPFVLSWSMLESMALGAPLIASATPPVTEVVADGVEGRLVDFFDSAALADRVDEALANRKETHAMAKNAREKIVRRYDLKTVCLPRQLELLGAG
jgi:glycosyltransferase involved in cell wall biosynthesis